MQLETGVERTALNDAFGAAAENQLPEDWPNRSSSSLRSTGGRRWHFQSAGQGPSMLLLHGTGASTHTWRALLPMLARNFQVLAPDLPGHAFTERLSAERLSLTEMSAALQELLEALDFEPDIVVGHSAGAAIGLRMALDGVIEPADVIGLNAALLPFGGAWQPLISPLARLCANVSFIPRFLSSAARDPSSVERMIEGTGSRIDSDGLHQYQQLLARESHVAAVLSMMANWQLDEFLRDLPRLRCRLHLVVAENDLAVKPSQADIVREILPTASVARLAGGHLAHEEEPGAAADLIGRLLLGSTSRP